MAYRVLFAVAILAACSTDPEPDLDAGEPLDAALLDSVAPDGGAPMDGGESTDGGDPSDAGAFDAGPRRDASMVEGPTTIRNYIFGHSLLVHYAGPSLPTAPDETTVPHWLGAFASADGREYYADGQYGFLQQHAELPPIPQWGFAAVDSVWSEGEPFGNADFTTVLLTAANFIQYHPPARPYEGDEGPSRASDTANIFQWVREQEPGVDVYIYENWPDMGGWIAAWPPTRAEFDAYNTYTLGEFHQWWLEYQDEVQGEMPDARVHMIPVGPIMGELLDMAPFNEISLTDLYEDDAPHGRPTIYFLAAMVCYVAYYQRDVPESFAVPESIHPSVRGNLASINRFIWSYLDGFNREDGSSRVWR